MSGVAIDYDPLKAKIGTAVAHHTLLRRLFYTALGMLFLRQWHVRAVLKRLARAAAPAPPLKQGGYDRWRVTDIFDAGSGFGQYSYLLARYFPRAIVHAVDVKQEQIDDCNRFARGMQLADRMKFELGDLTTFRRELAFDLALSVDVMEHIEDDLAVYRNLYASLRPGGVLIVATPSASEDAEPVAGEIKSVIGEHVREGYTRQEFVDKITGAGFKVEQMKRTYGPLWGKVAWYILQRIPMRLLTTTKLLAIVVIPWMIALYPLAALCMWLDVMSDNQRGGGWLMVARKP
ncbi:class I SAM-dependent methyltransferase [candidate division KSB1 bacterium]|nr:class I SAM-dependent methyltransferase [candidate division KSB1 bacterium]